ncbi:tetratricopeptide repeat protein [Thioclava sp. A2]|uniref:tetratricopeptide repeat protein n=1 Tax=Thioclava sp. FCG-A2 TaxID=3080562 RepID=UPI002952FAA4|nr:tetratricopeptide repeat protein [Thioclava sp. A2]MDV7270006.1 tetratricopeptide repeat protein [Thioclava sp. A2]
MVGNALGGAVLRSVVALICLAPLPCSAQQTAADLRAQAETLIYGLDDTPQNIAAGVALMGQAAEAGDLKAKSALGRILTDGYYLPADIARGLPLLEEAAQAGDLEATTALGGALLWGGAIPADPPRAQALLAEAAAKGSTAAQTTLGEQLIGGWILPRDVTAGRRYLNAAIAAGEPKAELALGGLYLYGIGVKQSDKRALELFEAAAQKDQGKGLWQYGEMLMWSERNARKAEGYLNDAADMGQSSALATLAEGAMYGYLGGGSASRRKFDAYAGAARAAGNQKIEVLDAIRQMWGISMRASGPKTLARLETAAEAGNPEAARFLIALLRDGNGLNVRRDRARAEALLARYAKLLSPKEEWQYGVTLEAAKATTSAARKALAAKLADTPGYSEAWLGVELYKANPNALIYVLQTRFRAQGTYSGPLDGYAGKGTIRAMNRACRALMDDPGCNDSVLRPDIVGAIFQGR